MKHALVLVLLPVFLISAFAQDAADKARAEAIRLYPELSKKDSPLNKAFIALHQQATQTDPKSLTKPDWPLTLAREAAASVGIAPLAPAPKPTILTLDIEVIQTLQNGVIASRMKAETWGSGAGSSLSRIGGGGNVAVFTEYHTEGEPIVVQGITRIKGKRLKVEAYPNGTYSYKDWRFAGLNG